MQNVISMNFIAPKYWKHFADGLRFQALTLAWSAYKTSSV